MWRFGFWELLIIVFVVLLVFGPKRLPQMGRSVGGAIRGFKDSVTNRAEQQDAEHEEEQKQVQAAQQAQLPPPAAPVAAKQPQADPRERDTVV
jgi:sec-independent protein translocase protein TatA